jgi:methionyl-tRNA formyltransferase
VSAPAGAVRVVFAGTPDVAVPALDALVADPRVTVVGVLTNPARPRGRTGSPVDPPVAVRARELGLPVLQPERPADALDDLAALAADVGAVVAYGAILPPAVLAVPRRGWVNLHFSLLPRWRGAAPVQHAVGAGDAVTGVTVFRLDAGMDTGPILRRVEEPLPSDADAGDLLDRLAVIGAPVLVEGALAAAAGEEGDPQPAEGATTAPRLGPDDAVVVWDAEAAAVARAVRAVTPRPGASTRARAGGVKLAGVAVVDVPVPAGTRPGTVLGADGDAVVVACGTGAVRVDRLQPAGRRWAPAADVLRGRGLAVGEVLGA